MNFCKLQLCCFVIVLYVAFIYIKGSIRYGRKPIGTPYSALLILSLGAIVFDGVTAYTVNHLDTISDIVNRTLHALFLCFLDGVIFAFFLYILWVTGFFPKKKRLRALIFAPVVVNLGIVLGFIGKLEFCEGEFTNYSMGAPAYTCFIMVGIYLLLSIVFLVSGFRNIKSEKRIGIVTYVSVVMLFSIVQMIFPEMLITSAAVTTMVLGVYLNFEDSALKELADYYRETVVSFATLVENRDKSTGGHIVRTAKYVGLITDELKRKGCFKALLTKDYVDNLINAAPMHDIGKISIPDSVLQKPGKLTDEEYAIMKTHSAVGGNIIKETFSNFGNAEYCKMAFEVARYHHEKWNGRGYPDNLKGEEIPVCARIMAVADVFDAVSAKRCYRDAMPLDKCFEIIRSGIGEDFDPVIAQAFLDIREEVETVCREFADEKEQIQQ